MNFTECKLKAAGQGHLVPFIDKVAERLSESFGDLAEVNDLFKAAVAPRAEENEKYLPASIMKEDFDGAVGLAVLAHSSDGMRQTWRSIGLQAISRSEVTAVILAGGHGTRLGFPHCKGQFPIGPISGSTIFEILVHKLLRIRVMAARECQVGMGSFRMDLWIMTSEDNEEEVRDFFKAHDYFGYPPDMISFFQQTMFPTFTPKGELMVDKDGNLIMHPSGNGAMLQSLRQTGVLDIMKSRGVKYIHTLTVDNPLSNICDPETVGFAITNHSEVVVKGVTKRCPSEKVGNFVLRRRGSEERACIVEYIALPAELQEATTEGGEPIFTCGSVCNFLWEFKFMEAVIRGQLLEGATGTVYGALKQVENQHGEKVDCVKPEVFLQDAIPLANRVHAIEVNRRDEFAPLKNKTGEDSAEDVRAMIVACHKKWLEAVGAKVTGRVEISPLVSYGGENLDDISGAVLGECYLHPMTIDDIAKGRKSV